MRTRTSRIADCGLGTDLGGTSSLRPPCLPSARACLYEQTQFGGTPAATCRPGPARAGCTNKPNSARSRRSSPYKQTQFRRANRPSQGPIMRNKAKLGHPGYLGDGTSREPVVRNKAKVFQTGRPRGWRSSWQGMSPLGAIAPNRPNHRQDADATSVPDAHLRPPRREVLPGGRRKDRMAI